MMRRDRAEGGRLHAAMLRESLYPRHAQQSGPGMVVPTELVPELFALIEGRRLLTTDARHPVNYRNGVEVGGLQPSHAGVDVTTLERLLCSELGHRDAVVSAEPVIGPFTMCLRCGRWHR